MQGMADSIYNLCMRWVPIINIVGTLSLVFCGFCLTLPSQKLREKTKESLPWIVLGIALVLSGANIVSEVASSFVFGG